VTPGATPALPDQAQERLDVFFNEELIGSVHDTSPLSFEYSAGWLARREPAQVSAITLAPGRSDAPAVQAFFENLLPEGDLRSYLAVSRKASTLFGLLSETAGDTAGGFVILPAGARPEAPRYEPTSWEALAQRLAGKSAAAIDIRGRETRISLAGAQDKTSIAIFADGVPQLRSARPRPATSSNPTSGACPMSGIRPRTKPCSCSPPRAAACPRPKCFTSRTRAPASSSALTACRKRTAGWAA
jgi:HipA-like protein